MENGHLLSSQLSHVLPTPFVLNKWSTYKADLGLRVGISFTIPVGEPQDHFDGR